MRRGKLTITRQLASRYRCRAVGPMQRNVKLMWSAGVCHLPHLA
jgi:hypothetical protein